VRGQIYLGSDAFVAQRSTQRSPIDNPEIPRVQQRPARRSLDELLALIARAYQVDVPGLLAPTRRPSEARQVALYAARRLAGADLGVVAQRFGLSYAGVSRRVSAVEARLAHEPRWRTRVTELLDGDGKVKT
jgi:chromosomal replication initiation ATPase DnaA